MGPTLQAVVVALVVLVAAGYATVRLMPAAARRAFAARAAGWATGFGMGQVRARRIEAKLASAGACGSCESCKACATTEQSTPVAAYRTIPIRDARR